MLIVEMISIFLTLAAALLAIGLDHWWRDRRTKKHRTAVGVLIIVMIGGFVASETMAVLRDMQLRTQSKDLDTLAKQAIENQLYGSLQDGSTMILPAQKNVIPHIVMGGEKFSFEGPMGRILKKMNMEARIDNGHLKFSTTIYGKDRDIVAEISDNEWKINRDSVFDRNYSRSALEVRNTRGDIVLQVHLEGNRLYFQGVLYFAERDLSILIARGEKDGVPCCLIEVQKPGEQFEHSVKPLFRYPSGLYLGEYVKN